VPDLDQAIRAAREAGINPGLPLRTAYPELDDALLIAITERRTRADIDRLADVLASVREGVPA
jgi:glycine dehydrogenase subunit 1